MNTTISTLIKGKAGRYLENIQDILLLLREVNKHADKVFPIMLDVQTVKNLANTVFALAAINTREHMKGGWEKMFAGADLNEEMRELYKNPALILYTQLLIGIVVALTASEPIECNCNPWEECKGCHGCARAKA